MGTEIRNRSFIRFTFCMLAGLLLAGALVVLINTLIDASAIIHPGSYAAMADLALSGHTVSVPSNYDERRYQTAVIAQMQQEPDTIVIGSSRGMYLGEEITGYENIYNHCVSGAILEDDYAVCGLYEERFGSIPKRVIMEISPWFLSGDYSENRWMENDVYREAAIWMFQKINGRMPETEPFAGKSMTENPYLSLSYFQYNLDAFKQRGWDAFAHDQAKVSTDPSEAADLADGTVRSAASSENPSEERLAKVRSTKGAVTYRGLKEATGPDPEKCAEFEALVQYLLRQGTEVIFYLTPYSVTQSHYIYDENLNPAIIGVERYLRAYGKQEGIVVIGGYDATALGLTDEVFIDYMHPDRQGNRAVWSGGQIDDERFP